MPKPNHHPLGHDVVVPQTEPIICLECLQPWTDPRERWRAFIADSECDDGLAIGVREVGLFCPECFRQEFDCP